MANLYESAYMEFLLRLRLAREELGLTQSEVARLIHRDQYWLSRSETGARRVDVIELLILAKLYKKELSYFTDNLIYEREE